MRSLLFASFLSACADLSEPAASLPDDAAPPPTFDLTVASRMPGARAPGSVANLPPGVDVWIAISSTEAPGAGVCPPAAGGSCSSLGAPATYVAHVVSNAAGWASFRVPIPANAQMGDAFYAQALAIDANGQAVWSDVAYFTAERLMCPDVWAPVCGVGQVDASNACYLNETYGRVLDHRGRC